MKKLYKGSIEEINGERGYTYPYYITANRSTDAHEILVSIAENWYDDAGYQNDVTEDSANFWWETPDGEVAWTINGPYEVKNIEVELWDEQGMRKVYLKAEETCLE